MRCAFFIVLLLLLFTTSVATPGQRTTHVLPAEWHGDWHGTMHIVTGASDDIVNHVDVHLAIKPEEHSANVRWVMTYGQGDDAIVKDYVLTKDPDAADRPDMLVMDENNGILLRTRFINNTLFSQFTVGEQFLTSRQQLARNTISFEVTSATPSAMKTNDPSNNDHNDPQDVTPAVRSYPVNVLQSVVFTKKNAG